MPPVRDRLAALALAAAVAAPASSVAQERHAGSGALGLSLGLASFRQRDQYLAPATYGGTLPAAAASYERRWARTILELEAAVTIGRTDAPALPRDVHQYLGRVALTLLRALGEGDPAARRVTVLVGGGFSAFGSVTDFATTDTAYGGTSYRDLSWYWSRSLDLVARGEYRLDRGVAALQVAMPAVRLVSRPESGKYFPGGNPRVAATWLGAVVAGSPELAWENPVLFCRVEVRQRLGGGQQLRASYDFGYAASDRPLALGMYWNRLQLGLLWPM